MRVNIKATNTTLTPAINEYLNKKMEHVEKFVDKRDESLMCDIEVGKTTSHHQNGEIFRAEINCSVKGKMLRAVAEEADLYAAIDIVQADIIREIKTTKEKKMAFVRRGGAKLKNLLKGLIGRRDQTDIE